MNKENKGEFAINQLSYKFLSRNDGTVDINIIIAHKNGQKNKYSVTTKLINNNIVPNEKVTLESGNKKLCAYPDIAWN